MNNLAEQVESRLNVKDVLEYYGIQFNSRGFARCPFHDEKTASLSIKKNHYKCFGCGAYGGSIDFVMNYFGLNFSQATVRLNSDFSLGISNRKPTHRDRLAASQRREEQKHVKEIKSLKRQRHLKLCEIHAILYGASLRHPEHIRLAEIVNEIDEWLDKDLEGGGLGG